MSMLGVGRVGFWIHSLLRVIYKTRRAVEYTKCCAHDFCFHAIYITCGIFIAQNQTHTKQTIHMEAGCHASGWYGFYSIVYHVCVCVGFLTTQKYEANQAQRRLYVINAELEAASGLHYVNKNGSPQYENRASNQWQCGRKHKSHRHPPS